MSDLNRVYGIPGPHDYDHDPGESQPLGPPLPKKKEYVFPFSTHTPEEIWYKVPGKPGLEINGRGQYRYTGSQGSAISPPQGKSS